MKKLEETFEINATDRLKDKQVLVRPEQTTDGIPVYHCFADGRSIGQLRRESTGEWTQIWGDLTPELIQQLGDSITTHRIVTVYAPAPDIRVSTRPSGKQPQGAD